MLQECRAYATRQEHAPAEASGLTPAPLLGAQGLGSGAVLGAAAAAVLLGGG